MAARGRDGRGRFPRRLRGPALILGLMLALALATGLALASEGPPRLGSSLESLEDPGGSLTLADLLGRDREAGFQASEAPYLNLGMSRSTFWVRFRISPAPAGAGEGRWLLLLDRAWLPGLELWAPLAGGDPAGPQGWTRVGALTADQAGTSLPPNRRSVFRLPPTWDQGRPFYLRLASLGPPLNLSLAVVAEGSFQRQATWDFLIFGVIYGVIAAMVIYNALLYFSLRDRIYLIYCLYMGLSVWYQAGALGHLLPIMGVDPGSWFLTLYVASGLTLFFAAWFCRGFLNTASNTPLIDKVLKGIMGLALTWAGLGLMGYFRAAQLLGAMVGVAFPITAIAAGVICLVRGFRPAGYYLAGWSVLAVGIGAWSLRGLGLLPQTYYLSLLLPSAVAVEALLLSLALADRIRLLRQEKALLEVNERRLSLQAVTDGLTGLYNRRFFRDKLAEAMDRAALLERPLCLILMDLDHFKRVNDRHGHQVGDEVLRRLAEILNRLARDSDWACRYGGEEFALILPGTTSEDALAVAERIRLGLAAETFQGGGGEEFRVTLSLGLAQHRPPEGLRELVSRCDQALYAAKDQGRDRTGLGDLLGA